MSMSLALARRIDAGKVTMRDLQAEAARVLAARASRSRRTAGKKAPGRKAAATKEKQEAAFYDGAKREAAERAGARFNAEGEAVVPPRCEVVIASGWRCGLAADDPDHVIGGAHRKDSERLGSEGLMCLCRQHHDMKHANLPTRGMWLDTAEHHALRHDYKRLLSLVARARAKHEGKRTVPVRIEVES